MENLAQSECFRKFFSKIYFNLYLFLCMCLCNVGRVCVEFPWGSETGIRSLELELQEVYKSPN